MIFKKAKNTPDPVLPEGWSIEVREQRSEYSTTWEYRLSAPERVWNILTKPAYYGSGYKTRHSAIVEAIDMAEFLERDLHNRYVRWEKV
jgi:hypothetical protein